MLKLRGDFNGLWGDQDGSTLLCLSHSDTAVDEFGNNIVLEEGIEAIAFDEDADKDGNRDDLIAVGIVEPSPDWLQCRGSRWVLRVDSNGVRNESETETGS